MKATLAVGMTMLALTACTMGITFNDAPITADAAEVEEEASAVNLSTVAYGIDSVQIRIGTDSEGNFDYTKNGIKFLANLDETTYNNVKGNVAFGILVFPYDYLTDGTFDETKVSYAEGVAYYDTNVIAFMETMELSVEDGYGCYSGSIVNLKEGNKARDFVAVPYLKADSDDGLVYEYKTVSDCYNMVDIATEVVQTNTAITSTVKTALKDAYLQADASVYAAAAGNYISDNEKPVVLDEDGNVTYYNDVYAYGGLVTGTYKLYLDGTVEITTDDGTMTATYGTDTFTLNGDVYTKVDMDALYTDFASNSYQGALGTSTDHNFYNPDWRFDATTKTFYYGFCSYTGKFEFIPITETFGKMNMTWLTAEEYKALGGTESASTSKAGYVVDAAYYVYDAAKDAYLLKISAQVGTGYNHFSEIWQKSTTYTGNYRSSALFNTLAGAGTSTAVTSKLYTDASGASLTLYNDGTKVDTIDHYVRVDKDESEGRVCTFYDGTSLIAATYDTVATSATTGKFMIDMYKYAIEKSSLDYYWVDGATVGYAQSDMSRFVVGDYTIADGVATITFSYKGVDYSFTTSALSVDASTYQNGENSIMLNADGTATYNGLAAIYTVAADNKVVITTLTEEFGDNSQCTGTETNSLRNFVYGTPVVGTYDADAQTITIGDLVLENIYADASDEVYAAFAGKYTSTYEFETDKTFTVTNLNTYDGYGRNTETAGTYKLTVGGGIYLTINGETTVGTYTTTDTLCSFELGDTTYNEVDTAKLIVAITGDSSSAADDKYTEYSGGLTDLNSGLYLIRFYNEDDKSSDGDADTLRIRVQTYGWEYTYELIPITATFGKIVTACLYEAEGNPTYYFGYALGEIYYTYYETENLIRLRFSQNVATGQPQTYTIGGGHFVDLTKGSDTFSTKSVFETLAGEYVDATVSKTYTDATSDASLTLYNDGKLLLSSYKTDGTAYTKQYMGGVATFNDGTTEIDATYNMIAMSATEGMFFIDMSATPQMYKDVTDKTRFVTGAYVIDGDKITITFTYNDVSYELIYNVN